MIKGISEITSSDTKEDKSEWFAKEYKKSFINLQEKPKEPEGII